MEAACWLDCARETGLVPEQEVPRAAELPFPESSESLCDCEGPVEWNNVPSVRKKIKTHASEDLIRVTQQNRDRLWYSFAHFVTLILNTFKSRYLQKCISIHIPALQQRFDLLVAESQSLAAVNMHQLHLCTWERTLKSHEI